MKKILNSYIYKRRRKKNLKKLEKDREFWRDVYLKNSLGSDRERFAKEKMVGLEEKIKGIKEEITSEYGRDRYEEEFIQWKMKKGGRNEKR